MNANGYRNPTKRVLWGAVALIPALAGITALRAQGNPTQAQVWEMQARQRLPRSGQVIFNDQSPRQSNHDLSKSTFVGYQVCAGCHGALNSTRPDHTIIQEWEATTNLHSNDAAALAGGALNVYTRTIADGVHLDGTKQCSTCHTTGAPDFDHPQVGTRNGFAPDQPWNEHNHNVRFLKVQCENCHGPASQHVLSGGNPRFINRVPNPKEACWKCHVHAPNEKGNTPTGPVTDATIALYSSSLGHTHGAGVLIAGAGGYEYAGENYDQGHSHPHTKIAATCVTCHTARDRRSPILDHSTLVPKIESCRNCHGDARNSKSLEDFPYMDVRQANITQLLIQLGGTAAAGGPDFNAGGGLLGNAADKTSPEYKRARWNYALVLNDASFGVHNYAYALELLLTSISHAPAQKTASNGLKGAAPGTPIVPVLFANPPVAIARPAVNVGKRG